MTDEVSIVITDVGQSITKVTGSTTEAYGYSSQLIHAWDWFIAKKLTPYSNEHGFVDWDWLIEQIEDSYNNPIARSYVYAKFLEEIGEHNIR